MGRVLSPPFWLPVIGHSVGALASVRREKSHQCSPKDTTEHRTGPQYFLVITREHMHLSQSLGTLMCSPRPSGPAFLGLLVIYPSFLRTHLGLVAEPGLSHSLNGRVFRGLAFFSPLEQQLYRGTVWVWGQAVLWASHCEPVWHSSSAWKTPSC